ncbi:dTDP-glucose 4,6-dehydratase [Romeria aff. gracilis LEGE 07310]|uniref:dTDP-glucose 4,6-dehydratase n=1 Tax=Vasconcelosia minhoensis LEGE 07310 TaxID=915328 RepID=A0A8J7AW73_9CYAN|nr:dTDP-glucose 4,6-dehydratase [Romeria gracilis]MBE9078228.1 dTDP-glucose 4,6-dehydratase [Romeria aff. gracilis LEGE 07310]
MADGMRRILVTGGAGFIGSNFVRWWCGQNPGQVVVLDALVYSGNRASLAELGAEQLRFVQGDICDRALVSKLLEAAAIDTIIHFAAESHVDRSILGPAAFVQTNMVGTFTLLEAFRDRWQTQGKPADYRFLHVSTDEVYGSLGPDDPAFTETTPYAPNSPYSASKAGSDHLVRAYFHTYGLPTLITNCSNNYGPYQFPEKLIPLMCVNILLGRSLPVYGDGQNLRDWLHVSDHCGAIATVLNQAQPGEVYNIGGNNQVKNIDIVHQLCDLMDDRAGELPVFPARQLITFVTDRPGHDRRYAMDIHKIQRDLGWSPQFDFSTGLKQTVEWYLTHRDWWQPLLSEEYQTFYQKLYGPG